MLRRRSERKKKLRNPNIGVIEGTENFDFREEGLKVKVKVKVKKVSGRYFLVIFLDVFFLFLP